LLIEIKSVNNRFFDISFKHNLETNFDEFLFRSIIQKHVSRGKLEVKVFLLNSQTLSNKILIDENFSKYLDFNNEILKKNPNLLPLSVSDLLNYKKEKNLELLKKNNKFFMQCMKESIDNFVKFREKEGKDLKKNLISNLKKINSSCEKIKKISKKSLKNYKIKLINKMKEFDKNSDELLKKEIINLVIKHDIEEEVIRISSHINKFSHYIDNKSVVGKLLEFLCQELNREVNTIMSKSTTLTIIDLSLDMKANIEKLREQVSNIE
jgi:uncharacterized protein (TIGR00255 family)